MVLYESDLWFSDLCQNYCLRPAVAVTSLKSVSGGVSTSWIMSLISILQSGWRPSSADIDLHVVSCTFSKPNFDSMKFYVISISKTARIVIRMSDALLKVSSHKAIRDFSKRSTGYKVCRESQASQPASEPILQRLMLFEILAYDYPPTVVWLDRYCIL